MEKKKYRAESPVLLVDIKGLQESLSVGRDIARRVGEESGAKIKLGNRTLYNVDKLRDYLNAQ